MIRFCLRLHLRISFQLSYAIYCKSLVRQQVWFSLSLFRLIPNSPYLDSKSAHWLPIFKNPAAQLLKISKMHRWSKIPSTTFPHHIQARAPSNIWDMGGWQCVVVVWWFFLMGFGGWHGGGYCGCSGWCGFMVSSGFAEMWVAVVAGLGAVAELELELRGGKTCIRYMHFMHIYLMYLKRKKNRNNKHVK